jgi:predicted amidophosphoribosyltransferase
MKYCIGCGKQFEDKDNFCDICGEQLPGNTLKKETMAEKSTKKEPVAKKRTAEELMEKKPADNKSPIKDIDTLVHEFLQQEIQRQVQKLQQEIQLQKNNKVGLK